jgi:hypothetical protein
MLAEYYSVSTGSIIGKTNSLLGERITQETVSTFQRRPIGM